MTTSKLPKLPDFSKKNELPPFSSPLDLSEATYYANLGVNLEEPSTLKLLDLCAKGPFDSSEWSENSGASFFYASTQTSKDWKQVLADAVDFNYRLVDGLRDMEIVDDAVEAGNKSVSLEEEIPVFLYVFPHGEAVVKRKDVEFQASLEKFRYPVCLETDDIMLNLTVVVNVVYGFL